MTTRDRATNRGTMVASMGYSAMRQAVLRGVMVTSLALSGLVPLVAGCGGDDDTCRGPDGPLGAGETFVDECNDCTCNEDGSITCVEQEDCTACTYEGQSYAVGDSWPKGDGCNICQCLAFDDVSCTEAACSN